MSFEAGTYRIEHLIKVGLLEIGDGYRAKNSELSNIGIPFARAANINDGFQFDRADLFPTSDLTRVGNKVSRPGDVVFTSKGTVGRFALVGETTPQFVYSPQLCFWRSLDHSVLLPEYLYYWMNSQEFLQQVSYLKGQTDMADYVSLRDQRKMAATIPSIKTQRDIVGVLKPIDDRIALLRETNATLEAIAQTMFKSWFVDFDPVRAWQQGLVPEGMDQATAVLFPDGFVNSELGAVPRGWQVEAIGDVVEGIFDGPHATPPEAGDGPVFLGIKNLTGTALDLSDIRHIAEQDFAQWTRRVTPRSGDIVFSYEATLGFFALIPDGLRCCLGRRLALIRPLAQEGYGHFWFHQLIAPPFQRLLEKHTIHGATVNRIALKEFPRYPVLDPPGNVKAAFDAVAAPLWRRIHANQAVAQSLIDVRDTLLPRLISGQLRLPEAEALAAAA